MALPSTDDIDDDEVLPPKREGAKTFDPMVDDEPAFDTDDVADVNDGELEAASESEKDMEVSDDGDYMDRRAIPIRQANGATKKQKKTQRPSKGSVTKGTIGFGVLSFVLPPVGLVLWLLWRKKEDKQDKARGAFWGFIASLVVGTVVSMVVGSLVTASSKQKHAEVSVEERVSQYVDQPTTKKALDAFVKESAKEGVTVDYSAVGPYVIIKSKDSGTADNSASKGSDSVVFNAHMVSSTAWHNVANRVGVDTKLGHRVGVVVKTIGSDGTQTDLKKYMAQELPDDKVKTLTSLDKGLTSVLTSARNDMTDAKDKKDKSEESKEDDKDKVQVGPQADDKDKKDEANGETKQETPATPAQPGTSSEDNESDSDDNESPQPSTMENGRVFSDKGVRAQVVS